MKITGVCCANFLHFWLKWRKILQVSLPHYADPEFHTDSLRRYKVFMLIVFIVIDANKKMKIER